MNCATDRTRTLATAQSFIGKSPRVLSFTDRLGHSRTSEYFSSRQRAILQLSNRSSIRGKASRYSTPTLRFHPDEGTRNVSQGILRLPEGFRIILDGLHEKGSKYCSHLGSPHGVRSQHGASKSLTLDWKQSREHRGPTNMDRLCRNTFGSKRTKFEIGEELLVII